MVLDVETLRGARGGRRLAQQPPHASSVAVVADSLTGEARAFFEHQADEMLALLRQADLVVGFNIVGFDFKVLSAYDDGTLARAAVFRHPRRRSPTSASASRSAPGEHTLGADENRRRHCNPGLDPRGRLTSSRSTDRADVRLTERLFATASRPAGCAT